MTDDPNLLDVLAEDRCDCGRPWVDCGAECRPGRIGLVQSE